MRIWGVLLAGCALSACQFTASTPDERLIEMSFRAADARQMVEFDDTLSHDFIITGYRGGLGSNPPREYLMTSVGEIAQTVGYSTRLFVQPQHEFSVSSARAVRALGLTSDVLVKNARMSSVRLVAQYGIWGEIREIGMMNIIRADVYSACSLALAAAGECEAPPTHLERIDSFSITDPCLLAAERRQHHCQL